MAAREAESPLEQIEEEAFKTRIRAAVAQSISASPGGPPDPLRLDLASAHDSRLEPGKCCSWTANPDGSFPPLLVRKRPFRLRPKPDITA